MIYNSDLLESSAHPPLSMIVGLHWAGNGNNQTAQSFASLAVSPVEMYIMYGTRTDADIHKYRCACALITS